MNDKKNIICSFCNKSFTVKQSLTRHQNRCKIKKTVLIEEEKKETAKKVEHDYITQIEELNKKNKELFEKVIIYDKELLIYKEELQSQKIFHLSEIKDIKAEIKVELAIKDEQIKAKNEYIKKLEDECNEYKKISKEALTKPTTVIDNSRTNNTTYNTQYNQMIGEIKPFTQIEVSKMVSSIPCHQLIGFNKKVDDNFVSQFVNAVKDLTFCTDSSRGNLVVKDEDGNATKMLSEAFVTECFKKGKKEIFQVIKDAVKYVNDAYESERYDYDEYSLCMTKLSEIKVFIAKEGVTPIVKSVSTSLVKSVKQLANNKTSK